MKIFAFDSLIKILRELVTRMKKLKIFAINPPEGSDKCVLSSVSEGAIFLHRDGLSLSLSFSLSP